MLNTILLAGVLSLSPCLFPAYSLMAAAPGPSANAAAPACAPAADPDGLSTDEREYVQRINMERTSRGLNALTVDHLLVITARAHSREMHDLNYFDHHSPTSGQRTPMERYLKGLKDCSLSTPDYLLVGENIFYCSVTDAEHNVAYGHQAFMNSPGHRANILEPRFQKVGLGIFRDAQGQVWVTEMFMKDQLTPPDASTVAKK